MALSLCVHSLEIVGDLEWCACLSLDFFQCYAGREFSEGQSALFSVDIEDAEVCDDLADAASTGQWQLALRQDLVCVTLGDVVHDDDDLGLIGI